ncbi:ABC transporter permease/M1 family aminopeptidase [Aquimarina litoralis]|uniref:ABC transporter permease/M1 family aminopeptidase n=1 Tax=Aquimarina litoralis TaxID=584605 RepID=UPI001C55F323|nr:M1 family aminopeptidase [Aquimarina litoralis]MBW1298988.1 peptidase M1 [Aquimarina litoralis]
MWYEIFKFEVKYRMKRPETYLFFGLLLLFSIVGVDFIFQGVEIGLMKKNAPMVIAKTMGAITGIFMIMVSMIMGVPILRDYQYNTEALLFTNPIKKREYLIGRFTGSITILIFIFTGLLFGMIIGSQMPWHKEDEMLAFNVFSYLQSFVVVVLPTLFFGASTFFVTGMLSKKLLVVYTQGIIVFVLFLLTKAIKNEYLQGLLDPFSLTTLTQYAKDYSVTELNSLSIVFSGILLHNKLLWMTLGLGILIYGYYKFSFSTLTQKPKKTIRDTKTNAPNKINNSLTIPKVILNYSFKAQCIQLYELSKFYILSLVKETSFWAIVICGIIIIMINSVNLGTVYGVNSYPETHFIIAELQEMSMYFFIIILLFYSGELIWKERTNKQYILNDATAISDIVSLLSKFIALCSTYVILMLSLILTGILFQVFNSYYKFELDVYFSGFFIEIFPFLLLYTIVAFFLQVISKNKFIGIFLTTIFFILNVGSEALGFTHSLYKFGGKTLGTYSVMNGYGHFLKPYLWVKAYWLVFGIILFIIGALLMNRGVGTSIVNRIKTITNRITKPILYTGISTMTIFLLLGCYIFYNTNVLNSYWTSNEQQVFRAEYEKTLKPLEYIPQPKITDVNLKIELYPETRGYDITGTYTLLNKTGLPINEIHIQKLIASHVSLDEISFEGNAIVNDDHQKFDYSIYNLSKPLLPNASIKMNFKQSFIPKGFEEDYSSTEIVYNGTFFNNTILPTLGYNRKYELQDEDIRQEFGLPSRPSKANIDDSEELVNARSGGDSDGIFLNVVVGTDKDQIAIAPGNLTKEWTDGNRKYFQYTSNKPIINFYSIVSAEYEVVKDSWKSSDTLSKPVNLEIYHDKRHAYNTDRMMTAMKASLSYFHANFSPYQYEQLRIMEFPRYQEFAQSLPNTIPFSEGIGFVLDIDDLTDVDMAFYITAHEISHQWFGMQIEAANVQGRNFILETLSQYGALMVLKQKYPKEKVQQFLELQEELYDQKRRRAISEPSLKLVANEDFVYYHKGAIAMYKLQQEIGEEQVNLALERFIKDWRSYKGVLKTKTDRYSTSNDLLEYFKEVTPKNKQYILTELFETNKKIVVNY